jgi:hypothetical protein
MHPWEAQLQQNRRRFITQGLNGAGTVALAHLLAAEGLSSTTSRARDDRGAHPLEPRRSHFAPRAKSCIYIYLEGGPSQMDLFDPKPKLNELDGEPLPPSLLENMQFAFLQKESARLMGTGRTFQRHGECGMELSELLPHLSTAWTISL